MRRFAKGCGNVSLRLSIAVIPLVAAFATETAPLDSKLDSTRGEQSNRRGVALVEQGKLVEAESTFRSALADCESCAVLSSILNNLGEVLARTGRVEEARAFLRQLTEMSQTRWVPASCFAVLHLGLGDYPAALTFLETATDRREFSVTALKVHPLYDPLRSEPRFQRLLERVGLAS